MAAYAPQGVDEVNKMAELGTRLAHIDGGVPNILIEFDKIDEYNIGQFIFLRARMRYLRLYARRQSV